ncbi:MAG: LON peptidase substrate-binding domain-containing protein [Armatimonadetes bacterium]|nr:LON peptidase substrate-binding domain-containing protein [Armatimonadota bacterium]
MAGPLDRSHQSSEELPLFLLETVLFPYATLQLHIFEARYLEMVQECRETGRPFGVVLIRDGREVGGSADPYMVGTSARILKVHEYDDGRLDLQVQGEGRFRIRSLDESRPFLVGRVEPVVEDDADESPRGYALLSRAQETFQLLIQHLLSKPNYSIEVVFPQDPEAFSFTIANLLRMDNRKKQLLLEITDTTERIASILPLLESQLAEVQEGGSQQAPVTIPGLSHETDIRRLSSHEIRDMLCNN